MQINEMVVRARAVRGRFAEFEQRTYGREWSTEDLVIGFAKDTADLGEAVQRLEGKRPPSHGEPLDALRHEIGDCLWSILTIADRYGIDPAEAFSSTMDDLDAWLDESGV